MILLSAELLTLKTVPQNDKIYVAGLHNNEEIEPSGSINVLLTVGAPGESLLKRCGCLIEIRECGSVSEIFNAVMNVFNYYNQWDLQLQQIIRSFGTVQNLIDCSASVFRNQIGIHNSALECIAETLDVDEEGDYERYRKITDRRINADYLKSLLEDNNFKASFNTRGPFFITIANTGHLCLAQNYFTDGEFTFRLVIAENKNKLYSSDLKLLQHLSEYIQFKLDSSSDKLNGGFHSFSHFLSGILAGNIKMDNYEISKKIAEHGWNVSDYYLCIIFSSEPQNTFSGISNAICKQLRKLIPNSEVFKYGNYILAVIDAGPSHTGTYDFVRLFSDYMRDLNMKAGVSNVLQGFTNLSNIYKQAEIALKIGLRLWSYNWIQKFSKVAPYYIMERCVDSLSVDAVCPPELIGLLKYDAINNTEYYITFKSYLECNQHLVETAKKLYIHRTTLIYRLNKIEQIFNFNLDDPLYMMYYRLSINLISYTGFSCIAPENVKSLPAK